MPRKKSTSDNLVTVIGSPASKSPPVSQQNNTVNNFAYIDDDKLAANCVRNYAENEYLSGDGAKIEGLRKIYNAVELQIKQLEEKIKSLQHARSQTPYEVMVRDMTRKIIHGDDQCTDQNNKTYDWAFFDKVTASILLIATLVMLAMSGANVYSILMAAGEPVFLEAPWLAVFIAALAPCASIAFKMMSAFFPYRKSKQIYALVVHVITVLLTLSWIICFAQNFSGVGASLDIDAMLDGNGGKSSLLVLLQLSCEIFVAASLFLAFEEVALKYSPFLKAVNPDYIQIEKDLNAANDELQKLIKENQALSETITQTEAAQNLHVDTRLAAFLKFNKSFKSFNS